MTHTAENHYSPSFFDDIRPYNDAEIPAAMHRIADSELLPKLAAFIFPGVSVDKIRALLREIKTSDEFQRTGNQTFGNAIHLQRLAEFIAIAVLYVCKQSSRHRSRRITLANGTHRCGISDQRNHVRRQSDVPSIAH